MRSGLRRSACAAMLVALVATSLLMVHVLVASGSDTGAHAQAAPQMQTLHGASGEMGGSSLTDVAQHAMDDHVHDVLACLALLSTAAVCILVVRSTRLRQVAESFFGTRSWWDRASQRAPPLSARLALVGISRR